MIWRIKERVPEEFIRGFPEYSLVVLSLLHHRGLKTQAQIDEFFNPDYEQDLHDSFLMRGIKPAVKRINQAIEKNEKIAIFGDYDADGICGAVILKTVLEKLGADLSGGIHIPNRLKEGYGLNKESIQRAVAAGAKLMITVDCGIAGIEEAILADGLGMDVIITDHHQPGSSLPPARAIINPWQKKDKYPFKELAGAGVAFKLGQALLKDNKDIKSGWEKWLLDLVALATVADCMPLLGENRTLVRYGLIVLAQTKRLGLRALMKTARLKPIFETEKMLTNLDVYSLGFVLAPRLNAAGRIERADLALDLLLTEDGAQAEIMAEKINDYNRLRQKMTDEIAAEIEGRIKMEVFDRRRLCIVAAEAVWSPGIIGLVAGKIADRHQRPAIIFCAAADGRRWRGSARSVAGFNIVAALAQCGDVLIQFGGHAGAAGLEILKENLAIFEERINAIAERELAGRDLTPALEVDFELDANDIAWPLFDELIKFEPFGKGNEAPVFLTRNFFIYSLRVVGNGSKHLKMELKNAACPQKIFKAIGFGLMKNGGADLSIGDKIDAVFEIIKDEWNGRRDLQLKIIDFKKINL